MATVALTMDNIDDLISKSNIVLIDFWADWCGPCKMFGPIFEKASEKHSDVVFAKCDTEAETGIAAQFGIRSIPTVAVFREKVLLLLQPGALPETALEDLIGKVKELDMASIHAEIAKQESEHAHDHGDDHGHSHGGCGCGGGGKGGCG
ncbi:MAG: thioredoxin [Magnetospirillum sp. WYHS-4]